MLKCSDPIQTREEELQCRNPNNRLSRPGSRVEVHPQGAVSAQFTIASSERWKDKNGELQERTEWFSVKAFGRRAEIAGKHLHKGSRVYLEGRKRSESWDDKKTGSKNYRDLVYVDRIEFLDSRSNGNGESVPDESAREHNASSEDVPF